MVREYCGHGIGGFHEEPQYYTMMLILVVLLLQKAWHLLSSQWSILEITVLRTMKDDGWTIKPKIAVGLLNMSILCGEVTDSGCEIMTLRKEEEPFISAVIVA